MNILADASLPGLKQAFSNHFKLTLYQKNDEVKDLLPHQDILLCRATLKVNALLLHNSQLKCVATASSGTDHLDHDYLQAKNITLIDAKGCNAPSVADYVLSCIAYLANQGLVQGSKAGIIGLGEVGSRVHKRLEAAGFQIASYDPPKAIRTPHFHSCAFESLFQADILCIHAELQHNSPHPSSNLLDKGFLNQLKPGCVIINAARGGIVDEAALIATSTPLIYCTDVYLDEPNINKKIISLATLCTPHIAGHSLEAKYAAVAIVSEKIHQLFGLKNAPPAQPNPPAAIAIEKSQSWLDLALAIYNPVEETLQFKKSTNLPSTFSSLRNAHQNRHNFSQYFNTEIGEPISTLMGLPGF